MAVPTLSATAQQLREAQLRQCRKCFTKYLRNNRIENNTKQQKKSRKIPVCAPRLAETGAAAAQALPSSKHKRKYEYNTTVHYGITHLFSYLKNSVYSTSTLVPALLRPTSSVS